MNSSVSKPRLRAVFDTSLIVLGLTLSSSNSRLVLDISRARGFGAIGIPELVLEETSRVLERTYGRRVVFSARSFLLRLCTLIPTDSEFREDVEKVRGLVPGKDLEVVAAVRVFDADRLVAYDRHFDRLKEYRTPKKMVEEFSVRPYPSQY